MYAFTSVNQNAVHSSSRFLLTVTVVDELDSVIFVFIYSSRTEKFDFVRLLKYRADTYLQQANLSKE